MGRGPQAMAGASSRAPSVTVLLHQNRAFFPGTGASCSCRAPTAPLPQGIETTPSSSSSHFGTLLTHLYAPQKLLAAFILITHCPDFCNASHIRWSPLQPQQIYYCEISNFSCRFPKSLSFLLSRLERAGLRPQARQEICVWCAWANSAHCYSRMPLELLESGPNLNGEMSLSASLYDHLPWDTLSGTLAHGDPSTRPFSFPSALLGDTLTLA